jgi:hypothetical protein
MRFQAGMASLFGFCCHAVLDRLEGIRPMDDIIFPVALMIIALIALIRTKDGN